MPTVSTRSCSSATSAAIDIFQFRKYAQITSVTSSRNTPRAISARSVI